MTTLSFQAAGATHLGTVRTNNEDAALVSPHLVALADGMGGHAAGEVASAVVVESLSALAQTHPRPADLTPRALRRALRQARGQLRALSAADPAMSGMGTTVVAVALTDDAVTLAHVGDSRLYRWRDGELAQMTVDHTHVQRLVDSGNLTPDAVRTHPFRSVILRSLDDTSDDLPDVAPTDTDTIAAGDRLLLCSDGLSDYLFDPDIGHILASGTPAEAADALVAAALDRETRDNVTVVVIDVVPGPGTPEPVRKLGASLSAAGLSPAAQAVMDAWDPAADLAPDAAERSAGSEASQAGAESVEGAVAAEGAEPDTEGAEAAEPDAESAEAAEPDAPPAGRPADPSAHSPADPPAAGNATSPATGNPRKRAGSRAEGLWLGLVVVSFLATTAVVWLTGA